LYLDRDSAVQMVASGLKYAETYSAAMTPMKLGLKPGQVAYQCPSQRDLARYFAVTVAPRFSCGGEFCGNRALCVHTLAAAYVAKLTGDELEARLDPRLLADRHLEGRSFRAVGVCLKRGMCKSLMINVHVT